METSMTDTEAHQSFRSPPRRRRSTFFERRDSIVPYVKSENSDPNKNAAEISTRQTEDMTKYYQKLLAEKEMWKKEVNDRRNKYHDLRKQYQIAVKSSSRSRMSYAALSNEDIEFLKGKPNIYKLAESQQKLHKSVLETRKLFQRSSRLDEVMLSNSEDLVNKVTKHILDNSTIEPVD